MTNNLGTPSSELQINFGVLQTDAEISATGVLHAAFLNGNKLCSIIIKNMSF